MSVDRVVERGRVETAPGRLPRQLPLAAAVVLTGAAVAEQAAHALGWAHGRPIPFLLAAAPAWALVAAGSAGGWARTQARAQAGTPAGTPAWVARVVDLLRRVPPWWYAVAVLALTAAMWCGMQSALPYLGHDEAVYATKARSWATGAPAAQWQAYRPLGLPVLARVAFTFGDRVGAARAVTLGLALLTLTITYLVAARLTTGRRAAVALLVVASGFAFQRRLPEFLDDIGAAGLLLAVAYLVARARQRPDSLALPGAAALAVAAFYVRYGALAGVVSIAVAAVAVWGPRAWLRPGRRAGRRLAAAGAVLLAGLVPHLVYAARATGSPLGVVLDAGQVAHRAYLGDGLVYYAQVFPFALAGELGGVVMAAGLLGGALAARRRWRTGLERPGDRVRVFCVLAAGVQVVLLGLTAHGEERFVFLPVLLLVVVGVDVLAEAAGRRSALVLAAVGAFALLAGAAAYRFTVDGQLARATAERHLLVAVARRVGGTHPCLVVTGYQPEIGWYSGCATADLARTRSLSQRPGRAVYLVWFTHGRNQPSQRELRRITAGHRTVTTWLDLGGPLGRAEVVAVENHLFAGGLRS